MSPAKSQDPMPEKSYLDWKVKRVRPRKTPTVISLWCVMSDTAVGSCGQRMNLQSLKNDLGFEECGHDTKRESLKKGEGGQEDIVEWNTVSLPI